MTVQMLLSNTTSQELTEWFLVYKLRAEEQSRQAMDERAKAGLEKVKRERKG